MRGTQMMVTVSVGAALLVTSAASALTDVERFGIASVSAGAFKVRATAGTSGGQSIMGDGITHVFVVDAPLPGVLHGRLAVRGGQTIDINTVAAAKSIVLNLADSRKRALGKALHVARIDGAGHHWAVRLPARIDRRADSVTFVVRYRAEHAYTVFRAGLRARR